jgi:hypothetical protein
MEVCQFIFTVLAVWANSKDCISTFDPGSLTALDLLFSETMEFTDWAEELTAARMNKMTIQACVKNLFISIFFVVCEKEFRRMERASKE